MLHIALTSYHLLDAKQKPYQKACLSTKNIEDISGEKKKAGEWARRLKKNKKRTEDRKSNVSGQKNKRGDYKVESIDIPETPDRGRHQTPPASFWG